MDILCPIVELLIVVPAAVLCMLPVGDRLRVSKTKLLCLALPALVTLCVLLGGLCYLTDISTDMALLPILLVSGVFYCRWVKLPLWKSLAVFLGVCGSFSCTRGLAIVADACLTQGPQPLWLSVQAGLIHNGICWLLVGLLWYPATHTCREILEQGSLDQSGYIFWIIPAIFLGLTLTVSPKSYTIIRMGYMARSYAITTVVLLLLYLLFYLLFVLMARGVHSNQQLQKEKQVLQMQASQYDSLRTSIAETRLARHDLRHHFTVLSALAAKSAWDELREYLNDVQAAVPDTDLSFCENQAVDGVAGYYNEICRRERIQCRYRLNLPRTLPVTEMELCMVLSNLLENAVEAIMRDRPQDPWISVKSEARGLAMVVLCIENSCISPAQMKDGVYRSSKRAGPGSGIESVRQIALRHGGYCKFEQEPGLFRASVVLRGLPLEKD